MVTTQASPHELQEKGKPVIVNCGHCNMQIWTDKAYYYFPDDEWFCPSCVVAREQ